MTGTERAARRLREARRALKPPPRLDLVQWADEFRRVAAKTSASPGRWKTSSQPVAFGVFKSVCEPDTHTVTVMAATQVVKSELLINVAGYFIHQDPSPILFVQPTQSAAESFSKERFAPTVEATPVLRELIAPSRSRDSENTITHKEFRGGTLDFVGANSPTDLASRPKRIILCDEIDKYPPSAGAEGDPLKLAEERASTYKAVGRSKSVRTCSPTDEDTSRIGREYLASDRRKCFVRCPHCDERQALSWANVRWDKGEGGEHFPETAAIVCASCGLFWSERDRLAALDELEHRPDHGWRQTREFICCGEKRTPSIWNDRGRSICPECKAPSSFQGHAGFQISKLYSKRHRLSDVVQEFLDAQGDPELLKKFTNTALADLWKPQGREEFDGTGLISRAENYGADDLPEDVLVITGFCDVQDDRLEVQLIGWGNEEEAWPFLYEVINQDPARPEAWAELDEILRRSFTARDGRKLNIAAFGIDTGGHHEVQVYAFCRPRRRRRVFPTKGIWGKKPLWPLGATRSKTNEKLWLIGVDAGKDALYARLKIEPPIGDARQPGYVHFPTADNFGPAYFEQLTSERRITKRRMGQTYAVWELPKGRRNEALDTFVGAMAVRKSLPRRIQKGLEYSVADRPKETDAGAAPDQRPAPKSAPKPPPPQPAAAVKRKPNWLGSRRNWL